MTKCSTEEKMRYCGYCSCSFKKTLTWFLIHLNVCELDNVNKNIPIKN